MWPLVVVSALTGSVLTVGLLAATGSLSDNGDGAPTVVREVVSPTPSGLAGLSGADVERVAAAVAPAIVRLEVTGGEQPVASAVVFRDDGYALTDAHLVDGSREIKAVLSNGERVAASIVGVDTATDLAVLELDGDGPFRTAVLGTTDGAVAGGVVIAVGAPTTPSGRPTVGTGVVSALGKDVPGPNGTVLVDMIQTDAPVVETATGGALVDGNGTVMGITMSYKGVRCATPVEVARTIAEELLAFGRVRTVWFGIRGASATDGTGVVVAGLMEGAPAAGAGLRDGDVIRRVDGRPVTSMTTLRMLLRRRHPGDRVTVVYERDGKRRSAAVALTERPS